MTVHITSFCLGALCVAIIGLLVFAVHGVVRLKEKCSGLTWNVEALGNDLSTAQVNLSNNLSSVQVNLNKRIDDEIAEIYRQIESKIDSKIDKLESRLKT